MDYSQIKDLEMNLWKFAPDVCEKKECYDVSDTFDNGCFCANSKGEALSSFLEHLDGSINCIEDGQNVLGNLEKIEKVLKYWLVNDAKISLTSKIKTTTSCFTGTDYILYANRVLYHGKLFGKDLDEDKENCSPEQITISFKDNEISAIIKRFPCVWITDKEEAFALIKRQEAIRKRYPAYKCW